MERNSRGVRRHWLRLICRVIVHGCHWSFFGELKPVGVGCGEADWGAVEASRRSFLQKRTVTPSSALRIDKELLLGRPVSS